MEQNYFTHTVTIRFFDIDAYNHVNNSVYFTYMEETRTKLLFDFYLKFKQAGVSFVVAEARCKYIKPIKLEDQIEVKLSVAGIRNTSFEMLFDFVGPAGTIHAKGYTKMACVDANEGKLIRLPQEVLDCCLKYCVDE